MASGCGFREEPAAVRRLRWFGAGGLRCRVGFAVDKGGVGYDYGTEAGAGAGGSRGWLKFRAEAGATIGIARADQGFRTKEGN